MKLNYAVYGVLAAVLSALAGCQPAGMLRTASVDATFRRVADRQDAYVNADPALKPFQRSIALRDTALLRAALDEAEGKTAAPTPPTTRP